MALRALLLARKGNADVQGRRDRAQRQARGKTQLTPEEHDLLHQFVFKSLDARTTRWPSCSTAKAAGLPGSGALFRAVDGEAAAEALFDRRELRPHTPGAGRYRHGDRDH